jgi:hypothetical protein
MTFWLGSLVFNSNVADGSGVKWYGLVDGWDTMAQRVADVAYPARHGGRVTQNLYEPRQLTLQGVAAATDEDGYWAAKNTLNAATNHLTVFAGSSLYLSMLEEVTKRMAVLKTSLHTQCIDGIIMPFELTLRADDPFKYASAADTLATSGTVVLAGTAPTYPSFTTSAAGVLTLTNGSQTWSSLVSLPSGTVINMELMGVAHSGTNLLSSVDLSSDWIFLNPGSNTLTSNRAGTWTWREAWL